MSRRAVVIGAGLGGLAVALRLAGAGWRVTLCEQGPAAGGKMNRWTASGFTFDTGPSLITMPWVFEELFAAAGARLSDHLALTRIDPLARYVFDDGTTFDYTGSMPEWLTTIRRLEPGDVEGYFRFLQLGADIFALSRETFFRRGPFDAPDGRAWRALRGLPIRHAWGNYHRTVSRLFRSPYLRQMFDRYPTYVGSSPYSAPATLAVIPYIEAAFGGWHVQGGLYRIVQALVELCGANGVELRVNAPVASIACTGRRVIGVDLASGERVPAEVVVSNADPSVVPRLLGQRPSPGLPAPDRSLSGFVMLLGVRETLANVPHHSIYFSADYAREFSQLFERGEFPDDPTVYVSVPSRTDRSLVPGGGDTLFIMANAAATGHTWTTKDIASARDRVLTRLRRGRFPLDAEVVVEDVWTPTRLQEAYAAPGGAIYGTHSHGWHRAFMRPPNKDRRVRGLYYVGGGTHPGGGTPTVLMSAQITSELIARHEAR